MNITNITDKVLEWYHLGGAKLVLKGLFTKFESNFLYLDESESPVNITLNGTKYKVSKGEPVYRWNRFERGVIMPEVKRPMDEILNNSDVFIDIGAAMGDTAFYGHSLVGEDGEVHAFEPDPFQFDNLKENINYNYVDSIHIYKQAIGSESGEVDPSQIIGKGSKDLNQNIDEIDAIPVTTLDNFIRDNDLEPDLVKIDVDGVEDKVIRGACENVMGTCPIILELHNTDILENRNETIDLIFECANSVEFLGVQGNATTKHRYGKTLSGPEDLKNDVVTNILIK